ncbi:MAG: sugar ABC transporter permease [Clostridia bacterium]|nr:sugar ABC transporter permease [Clostridia bacterium]
MAQSTIKRGKLKRGDARTAILFSAAAMLPMIVFWIYPIFRSIFISFTDWDYISPAYNMVGFENYANIFTSTSFSRALTTTLLFALYTVVPSMIIGLALAILFQRAFRGRGVYRALLFSPWVTPTVAVSIVWIWLFDVDSGLLNHILSVLSLPECTWLDSRSTALMSVSIVTVWKSFGYAMIFYSAALEKVPAQLYEAASIDGASAWQKFTHITFPGISPTTFFLMVMMMITSLQAYDQIQILTQGGPAGSTRTLLYLYYQSAFERYRMGEATAIAAILMLITVGLSVLQFWGSKKWVNYQ